MRLSRIDKLGIARVLDVVHTGTGGLVVTEWVRGGSLQEVADTSPSAVGRMRARCRPWPPRPRPPTTPASRCRSTIPAGCGSASKAMSCWPSRRRCPTPAPTTTSAASAPRCMRCWSTGGRCPSPAHPAGWRRHREIPAGQPLEPSAIDGDIPFQISAAATHSLQGDGGIRSAATLLNLLQQATAVADRTELLAPIGDDAAAAAPAPGRARTPEHRRGACARPPAPRHHDRGRRRRGGDRGRAAGLGLGTQPDVRRRRWPRQRPARPQRPARSQFQRQRGGGQHRQAGEGHGVLPRRRARQPRPGRAGDRRQPGHRRGRPTPTTTRSRSPVSRAASACCCSYRNPPWWAPSTSTSPAPGPRSRSARRRRRLRASSRTPPR